MSRILEERLKGYNAETAEGEFDALREILQEVILSGLSDTDFFNLAVFQGGTCLRLVHGLRRFSEDLDFVMLVAQPLFDFQWFVSKHVEPDLEYLESTLIQTGPWEDSAIHVTPSWLKFTLSERIDSLDWNAAKDDVLRFLPEREVEIVQLWSRDFFLSRIDKLYSYSNNK